MRVVAVVLLFIGVFNLVAGPLNAASVFGSAVWLGLGVAIYAWADRRRSGRSAS